MIEFKSFDLRIHRGESAGYIVEAIGPSGERATATFVWTLMTGLAADLKTLEAGRADRATMERVGSTLFQGLFPLEVMMLYVMVKAQLEENDQLRLRLHVPPELTRLPWELLYYPPDYLCVDPRSPVVRFLDLPDPPRPLAVQGPLRVLHLAAGPSDASPSEADGEVAQLRSALADLSSQVEIMPAQPVTLAALREGLRQGCQVLHLSSRGVFTGEKGYLLFDDQDGHKQVDGETLADLLRGTDVQLAILNTYGSALADNIQPFDSVPTALVRAGLPAVIAYQYAMPGTGATAFAAALYRALANGYPVDVAVTEGRQAIVSELGSAWRDRLDWAVPALFMRTPDGRILVPEGETEEIRIVQQVSHDSISIGELSGGQVVVSLATDEAPAPRPSVDLLPALLDELRQLVRDHAPDAKRAPALDQIAALKNAVTQGHPDLATLESVQRWFEAELPSLSGAVLSAILASGASVEEAGGQPLLH